MEYATVVANGFVWAHWHMQLLPLIVFVDWEYYQFRRMSEKLVLLPNQPPIHLIINTFDKSPNTSGISSPRKMVLQLMKELIDLSLPNLLCHVTLFCPPQVWSMQLLLLMAPHGPIEISSSRCPMVLCGPIGICSCCCCWYRMGPLASAAIPANGIA